jgi:hypothetical protein
MYYVPPPLVHVIPQKIHPSKKIQCSCSRSAPQLFSDKRVNESTETRVKTVSR